MKNRLAIENTEAHKAGLAEIDALFDKMPEPNSREGNRLKELIKAVGRFEDKFYPINFSNRKSA